MNYSAQQQKMIDELISNIRTFTVSGMLNTKEEELKNLSEENLEELSLLNQALSNFNHNFSLHNQHKHTHSVPNAITSASEVLAKNKPQLSEELLARQEAVIKTGSAEVCRLFAKKYENEGANIDVLQKTVIESENAEEMRLFAEDVKGADIEVLQKAMIDSGDRDIEQIRLFAHRVEGANVIALGKAVIESGDAEQIRWFAEYVKGADIEALQEAVIKSGDAEQMRLFTYREGADIELLQEAVIESGDAEQMRLFAYREGADKEALQKAVIESENVKQMRLFAEYVKGANIEALQKAVIESGDVQQMRLFAHRIDGADQEALLKSKRANELEEANQNIEVKKENKPQLSKKLLSEQESVIKNGSAEEMRLFAEKYENEGADVIALGKAVIESGDLEQIFLFAVKFVNVKGADIQSFQKEIIKSRSAKKCRIFAKKYEDEGADVIALGKAVIENGSAEECRIFAIHIKGADVEALQEAVIESGDLNQILLFAKIAKELKGADVIAFQKAVIKSGNLQQMRLFAKEVEGANIDVLQEAIIKSGNTEEMRLFAQIVEGADVIALQKAVMEIGNTKEMRLFAEWIEGADIQVLQKAVLESGDAEQMRLFAQWVEGADIEALQKAMIDSGDAEQIRWFAQGVDGADIEVLQKAMIDSGDVKQMRLFAEDVKGADKEALLKRASEKLLTEQEAVIESENAEEMRLFAEEFEGEGANIDTLQEAIIKSGDVVQMRYFAHRVDSADKEDLLKRADELEAERVEAERVEAEKEKAKAEEDAMAFTNVFPNTEEVKELKKPTFSIPLSSLNSVVINRKTLYQEMQEQLEKNVSGWALKDEDFDKKYFEPFLTSRGISDEIKEEILADLKNKFNQTTVGKPLSIPHIAEKFKLKPLDIENLLSHFANATSSSNDADVYSHLRVEPKGFVPSSILDKLEEEDFNLKQEENLKPLSANDFLIKKLDEELLKISKLREKNFFITQSVYQAIQNTEDKGFEPLLALAKEKAEASLYYDIFHLAVINGHNDVIEQIFKNLAHTNIENIYFTENQIVEPLQLAIANKQIETIEIFAKYYTSPLSSEVLLLNHKSIAEDNDYSPKDKEALFKAMSPFNASLSEENLLKINSIIDIEVEKENKPQLSESEDLLAKQEAIIKGGDAKQIRYFAEYVKGVDIEALQEAVIKSGNTEEMRYFAKGVEGADQEALLKRADELEEANQKIRVKEIEGERIKEKLIRMNYENFTLQVVETHGRRNRIGIGTRISEEEIFLNFNTYMNAKGRVYFDDENSISKENTVIIANLFTDVSPKSEEKQRGEALLATFDNGDEILFTTGGEVKKLSLFGLNRDEVSYKTVKSNKIINVTPRVKQEASLKIADELEAEQEELKNNVTPAPKDVEVKDVEVKKYIADANIFNPNDLSEDFVLTSLTKNMTVKKEDFVLSDGNIFIDTDDNYPLNEVFLLSLSQERIQRGRKNKSSETFIPIPRKEAIAKGLKPIMDRSAILHSNSRNKPIIKEEDNFIEVFFGKEIKDGTVKEEDLKVWEEDMYHDGIKTAKTPRELQFIIQDAKKELVTIKNNFFKNKKGGLQPQATISNNSNASFSIPDIEEHLISYAKKEVAVSKFMDIIYENSENIIENYEQIGISILGTPYLFGDEKDNKVLLDAIIEDVKRKLKTEEVEEAEVNEVKPFLHDF